MTTMYPTPYTAEPRQELEDDDDAEDDDFDDGSTSLLEEAVANKQSVQICRKNTPRKAGRMSLMSFFGQAEEEEESDSSSFVMADVASLEEKRLAARASREKKQLEQLSLSEGGPKRGRRRVGRSSTMNEKDGALAVRRMSTFDTAAAHKMRALSPTRMSTMRPLSRSNTTQPHSFLQTLESMAPPRSSDAARFAEHEETIKRLTVGTDEIAQILEDPKQFAKLQKVLRKHGAVTNEVLRQVLPLYVKHQINSQAAKAAAAAQGDEAEEEKCMDRQQTAGSL
ncbi:expressed unknown protein [Seminavis robusta]|uniref:Uncharacterized protein n=1 Tax=Seminavis robusta TaxID=568900 RepID=A0A9N8H0R5_9STRA|nr:expressed unknown protein [Seminavis robusta]|eukprot:Sro5_g004400.1 n/a (282) ;mRNA; r:145348-146193